MSNVFHIFWFAKLCLIAVVLMVSGAQDYLVYLRNPEPAVMSLDEYLKAPQKPEWVQLTACEVDYPRSICIHNLTRREIHDVSAPAYPDSSRGPVRVVLAMNRILPDNAYRGGMIAEKQSIQGLVRSGFSFNSKLWPFVGLDSRLRKAAHWQLDDDYVVIDEGAEPNSIKASSKIGGGVLLGLMAIWAVSAMLNRPAQQPRRSAAAMLNSYY